MDPSQLTVVYHIATMAAYAPVIEWQLAHLAQVGLHQVLATHVGPNLEWVRRAAAAAGVQLDVRYTDPNTDHAETPAMFLIQQLAQGEGAVLYLHTKGITQPHLPGHRRWRELMHEHVVAKWREHLARLDYKDICGLDWIEQGNGDGHFSGNFWLARLDYVRRLPDFGEYHRTHGLSRYNCEQWIGKGQPPPRVHSEHCMNVWWSDLCRM
jgi:hypothetical protein